MYIAVNRNNFYGNETVTAFSHLRNFHEKLWARVGQRDDFLGVACETRHA